MPETTKSDNPKMDRRVHEAVIALRAKGDAAEPREVIEGYAALYDVETQIGPDSWGFREVLAKGCFDAAIGRDDVRALFNHSADFPLGRTKAKTLRLESDDKGLRYEIDPPKTSYAADLMESMRRGDVTGSSFSFIATREEWIYPEKGSSELPLRRVLECELFDVAPVVFPAYEDTSVAVAARSKSEAMRTAPAAVPAAATEDGAGVASARAKVLTLAAEASGL